MSELTDPPFGRKNPCEPPRITDGYDFVVINGVRYVREGKKIPGPATKAMLDEFERLLYIQRPAMSDDVEVAVFVSLRKMRAIVKEWEP